MGKVTYRNHVQQSKSW